MPVSVLLADDHHLVRAGIRALLEESAEINVVGEATDGRKALELIDTLHPDIVLMDIAMPGLNGLEAIAQIGEQFPYVRVIVLSMYANEEYVLQALRLGACGYLLKDADPAELRIAVHAVSLGDNYLSPSVSRLVSEYIQRVGTDNSSVFDILSHRQLEVLQLIAEGHTTRDIGRILGIHPKTIETHRRNLMENLDIHDIAGLVRYAIRIGLVSADTE